MLHAIARRLRRLPGLALLCCLQAAAQPALDVPYIMRDPKWMGSFPSRINWSYDSRELLFYWNPQNEAADSLYSYAEAGGGMPQKVSLDRRRGLPAPGGIYDREGERVLYGKNGDLFVLTLRKNQVVQLSQTVENETPLGFSLDGKQVLYLAGGNVYAHHLETGGVTQLSDFRKGDQPEEKKPKHDADKWLAQQELRLIETLAAQKAEETQRKIQAKREVPHRPKSIYAGERNVEGIGISPDMRFISYRLVKEGRAENPKVPAYVTATGYTESLSTRSKVGTPQNSYESFIYDRQRDSVYKVIADSLPGISLHPQFLKEYGKDSLESARHVMVYSPLWSPDGSRAVVEVRSLDFKERWIARLDAESGMLRALDHQHDEAWIDGPGIGRWLSTGSMGWMPDNWRVWFISEASGYAQLYTTDVGSGHKTQLTSGNFEVSEPYISRDKQHWYFTSNEVHPGEKHFYRMALAGGERVRLTQMTGFNEVRVSPDEKHLAVRHSYSNKPWALYIQENRAGAPARLVADGQSAEFKKYPWRAPEIISFEARDSAKVYARLYRPANAPAGGKAVIFVHGAGYLQNAHKGWSSYFREYMFHNLLVDKGYTVLDMDFRASAGYGRDWRTDVYRDMGGKDLSDQVDGARLLVQQYGIDPDRIGIYGGSYGGFITLMAMFREPGVFKAGAALRPVTDWAHYNHGYTGSMLNLPQDDSLAYQRSSPIYHAEGLSGHLLICHGMVDVNVHFQDVVRLAQRLIELGKDNWEVAVYPLEDHGFRHPSSWTDEYKRILKLFEERL